MPPKSARPIAATRRHITALVYGWPGSGKTPLIGSCTGRILIAECDPDGTASLAGGGRTDIDVVEIYNRAQWSEFVEYVRDEGHQEYDWVWVDSLSGLQGRLMSDILAEAHAHNPKQNKYIADKSHYQLTQNMIDSHIKWLLDVPVHVGVTAHVMIQQHKTLDEEGNEEFRPMYMPDIQGGDGKMSQKISGYFSLLGFLEQENIEIGGKKQNVRVMRVAQDLSHQARDRYRAVGLPSGKVVSPDMGAMQGQIMRKLSGEGGPRKTTGTKKVAAKKATKATKKRSSTKL